jgi:hypothetical protein
MSNELKLWAKAVLMAIGIIVAAAVVVFLYILAEPIIWQVLSSPILPISIMFSCLVYLCKLLISAK